VPNSIETQQRLDLQTIVQAGNIGIPQAQIVIRDEPVVVDGDPLPLLILCPGTKVASKPFNFEGATTERVYVTRFVYVEGTSGDGTLALPSYESIQAAIRQSVNSSGGNFRTTLPNCPTVQMLWFRDETNDVPKLDINYPYRLLELEVHSQEQG